MTGHAAWRTTERLAWTEHDGPDRPPGGSHPLLNILLAGVLAAVFAGMVFTDTLCPEHRAIVQTLGTVAMVGCVASAIALARGWAAAPAFTGATAVIGVGIGYIDATHDSTRGSVIAVSFAVALAGAAWLLMQQLGLRLWQKNERRAAAAHDALISTAAISTAAISTAAISADGLVASSDGDAEATVVPAPPAARPAEVR